MLLGERWEMAPALARYRLLGLLDTYSHPSEVLSLGLGISATLITFSGGFFYSSLFFWGWLVLGLTLAYSIYTHHLRPLLSWTFLGMVGIILSSYLAVIGTIFWGSGNWVIMLALTMLITPMPIFYLVRSSPRTLAYIIPGALLNSGVILYQGLVQGMVRSQGLGTNPNPSAGFLVLAAVYLLTTRYKWLAVPLVAAIPLTGSRSAVLIFLALLIAMTATRRLKPLFSGILLLFLGIPALYSPQMVSDRVHVGSFPYAENLKPLEVVQRDVLARWEMLRLPHLLPKGDVGGKGPPHLVPLRIAVELGLVAALIWIILTSHHLWKSRKAPVVFWSLLTVVGLGVLDHYTWIGSLSWSWWMVLGLYPEQPQDLLESDQYPA